MSDPHGVLTESVVDPVQPPTVTSVLEKDRPAPPLWRRLLRRMLRHSAPHRSRLLGALLIGVLFWPAARVIINDPRLSLSDRLSIVSLVGTVALVLIVLC
jgi:hypothetical protein